MEQNLRPITIDGTEYFTKKQVCQMTGYTLQSLNQKIRNGLDLKIRKMANGRCFCRKYDVEQAISSGVLVKGVGSVR